MYAPQIHDATNCASYPSSSLTKYGYDIIDL